MLPGGHHHSVKGVCMNDSEVEGSWSFETRRSTRDRYRIPDISKSGASASAENDGLLPRIHGILILTDPVCQGPPAIGEWAANSSRRRSSVTALNSESSSRVTFPEQMSFTSASIPWVVFEDGPRQDALTISNVESFLNGWGKGVWVSALGSVWLASVGLVVETRQIRNLLSGERCGDDLDMSGVDNAIGSWVIGGGSTRCSNVSSLIWGITVTGVYDVASKSLQS